ncbi:hypothetical protein JHK87_054244 [Glycine soja]|nr:hypothetical protein JHK87_054244 [Glycine soja]
MPSSLLISFNRLCVILRILCKLSKPYKAYSGDYFDDTKRHEEATKDSTRRTLKTKIKQLTNQVHAERETSIKLSNSKIAILTLEYIRMTLEECKSSEEALSIIQEFVKTTDSQIQSEKQQVWSEHEGDKQPCSDQCYLLLETYFLALRLA